MNNIFLFLENQKFGPYSIEQLQSWVEEGRVKPDSLCWHEGMAEWQPLKTVFPNLFPMTPPPIPPQLPPQPPSQPQQFNNNNMSQTPAKKSGCKGCFSGCLSVILVIILIVVGLLGYGYYKDKKDLDNLPENNFTNSNHLSLNTKNTKRKLLVEKQLDFAKSDVCKVEKNNIKVKVYNSFDSEEQILTLSEVENFKLEKGIAIAKPVEIKLKNKNKSNFPIEIQIKHNKSKKIDQLFCMSVSEDNEVDYPFCFEGNNSVTILTNHLTEFYPLSSKGKFKYSPTMTLPSYLAYSRVKLSKNQTVSILKNYRKNIKYVPSSALNDFWVIFNENFGIDTNITAFAENAMYMEGFSKFNSYIPEVGLSLSFVQLGIDLYNGNEKPGVLNFTKNLGYYGIGKTFPTRAMNIAMVGVFVIDYSLNKFAETALSNRKRLYQKISSNWLLRKRKKGETGKWWYKKLLKAIDKYKDKPNLIGNVIDREFDRYVAKLWEDENEIALLQSELGQTAFTAGGGLNKKLIEELTAELKDALKSYNKPVIDRISKEYLIRQQNYARDVRIKTIKYLNQKHKIKIIVTSKKGNSIESLKGIEVGIKLKNRQRQKMWQKKLSDEGEADLYCTNLGFINAGLPHIAYLKIPIEGEKPLIIEKKFKLKNKTTVIKFIINEEDITGEWEGYFKITKSTYFESMLKVAVFVFRAVGMNEKEATEKLAATKAIFQEPEGLKRKRYMKMVFKSIDGIEKYAVKATIEGDDGRKTYSGKAILKKGQFHYELNTNDGTISFKGSLMSPRNMVGTFFIGATGFHAAEGKWALKKKNKHSF